MIAAVLHGIGEPIQIEERTSLHASPGHQVVRLKYAAINHRDLWIQQGKYAGLRFPIVLGSDGMGQVDQRDVLIQPGLDWGTHQTHQERSYRILGLPDDGTFATEVVVPQGNVFSVPGHLSPEEAAALPLAGLTAYRAVMVKAEVSSGEKVLVTGIGGGVATLAMQMALAQGAEVYVTSGSVEKINQAKSMGVAEGFVYKNPEWSDQLKNMTGGIHKIIDGTGGQGFSEAIDCLSPGGIAVNYGGTAGDFTLAPRRLFWNQLTLKGTTMGTERDFADMLSFVHQHRIHPVVAAVFPLDQINEAFNFIRSRSQFGKVVLAIPGL